MKVLKFTEHNLETIARVKGKSHTEVIEIFEDAKRLDMEIYSVVDFVGFVTNAVIPEADYVEAPTIHKWFEFKSEESYTDYNEVSVKRDV